MTDLSYFYIRLGAIGVIMALGFLLGKLKLISDKTNRELANLLLTVFMPASLFTAFPSEYDEGAANLFFSGLTAGVIVMLSLIIVAKIIFNEKWLKKGLHDQAQFALIFNNATFLGYPIIASTFGANGILAYCGFIVAFNVALFSYGIWLFKKKIDIKLIVDVILNPNIIAVALGMVLFLFSIQLPDFIADAAGYVGGATTPLSIICIGYMLSQTSLAKAFKKWRLTIIAISQLIIGPVITWGLLTLLKFPAEVIEVCTLIQALPTATSLGLFAVKYDGNASDASELVAASTIFSIFTLPIMVFILLGAH